MMEIIQMIEESELRLIEESELRLLEESDLRPGEIRKMTVSELAEIAFHAAERVHMLSMMNTPQDFDERKKAFIKLSEARAASARATLDLESAVKHGNG